MARRACLNRQGLIIMGAAAQHRGLFCKSDLAEKAGIPGTTLDKRIRIDFGSTTIAEFRAIVRASGMTPEEIMEVLR